MRQQVVQRWIKAIVLSMILICSDQMSGQTIGLQVEPDHNVLFGDSISGAGTRLMWLPGNSSIPDALLHIESDQSSGRTINLALVAGPSKRPSIQFSELGGNGSSTSGMSIEYNGTGSNAENEIRILDNQSIEVFSVHTNGDVDITGNTEIDGFVKLGDSAPGIKMKELSGTTPTTGVVNNVGTVMAHGLTASKIISITARLKIGNDYIPPHSSHSNLQYSISWDDTNIVIFYNVVANSVIKNKPIEFTIIYKE